METESYNSLGGLLCEKCHFLKQQKKEEKAV